MGSDWGAAILPALLAAATLILLATRALRADGVAVLALTIAVATGLISPGRALAGFSDPVIVTIGALAILAASVHRSGIVDAPRGALLRRWRLTAPVLLVSGMLVAALAAISGRVGTRSALLRSSRLPEEASASRPVLILNLACLLGGTLTVVGGVPNLLASALRADWLGAPFPVLAFLPTGLLLLLAGLLLFALFAVTFRGSVISSESTPGDQLRHVRHFTAELAVPPGCALAGRSIGALEIASENAFRVVALVREGLRRIEATPDWIIEADDVLVLDCQPGDLQRLVERWALQPAGGAAIRLGSPATGATLVQAVVTQSSGLIGRAPPANGLLAGPGLYLLGLGRNDAPSASRLRRTRLRSGDILVLAAEGDAVMPALSTAGCLLLTERRLRLGRRHAALPLAVLLLALLAAASGALPLWLALLGGVLVLVLSGLLTLGEAYERVPWPGLVMIAALLPLATAIHDSPVPSAVARFAGPVLAGGGATLAAATLLSVAVVASLLVGAAAAVLLLCPFALALATATAAPVDALLVAVAIGAGVDMLDGRGFISTIVPAPGRRPMPLWPSGVIAAVLLILCGSVAVGLVWRA